MGGETVVYESYSWWSAYYYRDLGCVYKLKTRKTRMGRKTIVHRLYSWQNTNDTCETNMLRTMYIPHSKTVNVPKGKVHWIFEKWTDQHDHVWDKEKNLSPWQESNPWPRKQRPVSWRSWVQFLSGTQIFFFVQRSLFTSVLILAVCRTPVTWTQLNDLAFQEFS